MGSFSSALLTRADNCPKNINEEQFEEQQKSVAVEKASLWAM